MDVVEILTEFALVANRAWFEAPEGPKRELMAELADSLRKAADAKLEERQKAGSPPSRSLFVMVEETTDGF